MAFTLFGKGVAKGIAIGKAYLIDKYIFAERYFILAHQIQTEILRFEEAIEEVKQELETLKEQLNEQSPEEFEAFLNLHLLILNDPILCEVPKQLIQNKLYNAQWALLHQLELLLKQFDEINDPYLKERTQDIEQIVERVLKALSHEHHFIEQLGQNAIVVAHDVSPADMLQFKTHLCIGFITDVGGQNSHTAILARSMSIPTIVGSKHASQLIKQDDTIIIDADNHTIIINPSNQLIDEYQWRQQQHIHQQKKLNRLRDVPCQTLDGQSIELLANIESPIDCSQAIAQGAQGVGLFRSEFLFMQNDSLLPDEETQFVAYYETLKALNGKPLTIRTIDIGMDKQLKGNHEINHSALGLRAIRWSLSEPEHFLTQLKAILRASYFGKIRLLIPMLAHLSELKLSRKYLEQAKQSLKKQGIAFDENIELGVMVEIPATAFAIALFFEDADFFSIGTNDLVQYMLAVDRNDNQVAHLYDPYHPAIIQLLSHCIQMANIANKPISICGELASDSVMMRLLLGMGLKSFSMHPNQLLNCKAQLLNLDTQVLKNYVNYMLGLPASKMIEAIKQIEQFGKQSNF